MIRSLFTLAFMVLVLPTAVAETGADVKLNADEKALIDLLNKSRAEAKLSKLKVNPTLCKAAKQHTLNMAKQEKMEHKLDGEGVAQRVTAAGYDYRKVGENLARADGEADDPAPAPADIHQRLDGLEGPPCQHPRSEVYRGGSQHGPQQKGNVFLHDGVRGSATVKLRAKQM